MLGVCHELAPQSNTLVFYSWNGVRLRQSPALDDIWHDVALGEWQMAEENSAWIMTTPASLSPPQLHTTTVGLNPGLCSEKPVINYSTLPQHKQCEPHNVRQIVPLLRSFRYSAVGSDCLGWWNPLHVGTVTVKSTVIKSSQAPFRTAAGILNWSSL